MKRSACIVIGEIGGKFPGGGEKGAWHLKEGTKRKGKEGSGVLQKMAGISDI